MTLRHHDAIEHDGREAVRITRRRVRELVRGRTQAAAWELVKERYPRMKRDLVRELWRSTRS